MSAVLRVSQDLKEHQGKMVCKASARCSIRQFNSLLRVGIPGSAGASGERVSERSDRMFDA